MSDTEQQERLQIAVDIGGFGVWELSSGACGIDASALFRSHLGLSPTAPIGLAELLAAIHPEHREAVAYALRQAFTNALPFDKEFQLAADCGTNRWVQLKARAHLNAVGAMTSMVGISHDVTNSHRTSDDLQKAQILIRGVLETETGLIYAKDREGRMLMANPPALALIGKPWSQVQGRTDAEFLNDPAQSDAIMENDRRIMMSGIAEVLEEHVDDPHGRTAVWLSTKSPLRDEAGYVVGLVGVSQDISDRKRVEQELRELNETLEQKVAERTRERDRAWNNSQDMQLVIDGGGIILAVNPAWTAVLGWSAEDLLKRSFLDFLHPDHLPANQEALIVARDDRFRRHENRYRHKDGSHRWIEWVTAPEGDRIYASGRDITAEKATATALATKASQLEISNKELESFSYSVSHDLRSPIRAIDGFATILVEEHVQALDEEGRRLLAAILRNSHRMGVLIDDLLAFSRVGHMPISTCDVDMQSLVSDVLTEVTHDMSTAPPKIRCGNLAPARGDRAMLQLVWTNLIANAVKYSSKQAMPEIELSSTIVDGEIVYRVRDNGVGFDMKYADKLFGVFQRLHAEAEFKGTGVGLALAQRIVSRHGGRIWGHGATGEGATFCFTLPP